MQVKVRKKKLSSGRISLYLEIYRGNGKRTKEYLGLYIAEPAKNATERAKNRETLALAEKVRVMRQAEVDNGKFGFITRSTQTVGEYLLEAAKERNSATRGQWISMLKHLNDSGVSGDMMASLSAERCDRFRRYLMGLVENGKLRSKSADDYFGCFRVGVRQAYRHEVIREPIHERFGSISGIARRREFLTIDEARKLKETPYREPLRSIFLFAILMGFRTGEIRLLTWDQIQDTNAGAFITYYQPKTKKHKRRKMPQQARALLGKRRDGEKLWAWVPAQHHLNNALREWIKSAGIERHLSMHCLRHTFATLQLSAGTTIEVVSDMLDHSNIRTTQIYAKVLDNAIDEAAERIIL